jgi:hypothetical protein
MRTKASAMVMRVGEYHRRWGDYSTAIPGTLTWAQAIRPFVPAVQRAILEGLTERRVSASNTQMMSKKKSTYLVVIKSGVNSLWQLFWLLI